MIEIQGQEYFEVKDVARRCEISPLRVYADIRAKRIKYFEKPAQPGRKPRKYFKEEDVETYNNRCVKLQEGPPPVLCG